MDNVNKSNNDDDDTCMNPVQYPGNQLLYIYALSKLQATSNVIVLFSKLKMMLGKNVIIRLLATDMVNGF